jgi:PPOX class probable F420-dependent enzyme
MIVPIPDSHKDLIEGTYNIVLTTVMPDGQPQTTPIWCNTDGEHIFINCMSNFCKTKNMQANPKVTVFVFDPQNPLRNMEIRGTVVEMTEDGAEDHLDDLTELYTGQRPFFGVSVPTEMRDKLTPVKIKIAPRHVRVEG